MRPLLIASRQVPRGVQRVTVPVFTRGASTALKKAAALSQIINCRQYLNHCKANSLNLTSTVFKGTLYEYTSKEFLEDKLKCFDLVRKGGAFDNGIDLVGKWDLHHFFKLNEEDIKIQNIKKGSEAIRPLVINSKEFSELTRQKEIPGLSQLSMKTDINVLVQCKNHSTKIKASVIRELVGIYLQHIRTDVEKNSTFMILISPGPLTKQAQSIIDQTSIPLIHIILSSLQLTDLNKDAYDMSHWAGGVILSIYLNSYAKILLKYLNIELEFQKLKAWSEATG